MGGIEFTEVFARQGSDGAPAAGDALLLPHWSENEWRKLLARTIASPFSSGEVVIQRGAVDRSLFLVGRGTLEVGITHVDGVSISPLARIGPGSVIGEQSFFDSQPRSANVWAVDDGTLLRLDYDAFHPFGQEEPALARDLLFAIGRVLSTRLRNTTFRVRR